MLFSNSFILYVLEISQIFRKNFAAAVTISRSFHRPLDEAHRTARRGQSFQRDAVCTLHNPTPNLFQRDYLLGHTIK
jgi:hypothetical protein